ncbi:hypothetical protein SPARK1531C2_05466 [Klebsiella grimontii]|nr:hypothetical protein SPARK1531C2_05466 [Klebsiella grimontii]
MRGIIQCRTMVSNGYCYHFLTFGLLNILVDRTVGMGTCQSMQMQINLQTHIILFD